MTSLSFNTSSNPISSTIFFDDVQNSEFLFKEHPEIKKKIINKKIFLFT